MSLITSDKIKAQLEQIEQLQIAYRQAMQKTRHALEVTYQEQRRGKELRKQYRAVDERCAQLQAKIEAEKAKHKTD